MSEPSKTAPSKTAPPRAHGDSAAEVEVSPPHLLGQGFRDYLRYDVRLHHEPGGAAETSQRDIVVGGRVVAVLCFDPARDRVVLIHQFRLAAHLATGLGRMVEIVAGRVDPGEAPAAAAHRECLEEIGIAPTRLEELFKFMPTPGVTDEICTLYLGIVESHALPARAGLAHEHEVTAPFTLGLDDALALLSPGCVMNGYTRIALQWLALNRPHLAQLAAKAKAKAEA
ncbi:NUDIX hydrolase [Xanthobacter sp. VTT E-85241]|uniref:NUDIX domain-containing protein n=1 Tax=Roseixanthobacter finlandensis TaxID=3119922 RepID=UPI00372787EB